MLFDISSIIGAMPVRKPNQWCLGSCSIKSNAFDWWKLCIRILDRTWGMTDWLTCREKAARLITQCDIHLESRWKISIRIWITFNLSTALLLVPTHWEPRNIKPTLTMGSPLNKISFRSRYMIFPLFSMFYKYEFVHYRYIILVAYGG